MKERFKNIFCVIKIHNGIFIMTVLIITVLLSSTLVGFTAAKDNDTSSVENINLTVTGCNVTIKTLSGNVVGTSSAKDGFRYEIDETIHKLTATRNGATMTIALKSMGNPNEDSADMAVIFIPEQQYSKITVVGNHAGVSLPPLNVDYNLTSNNSAMSVRVLKEFSKTIDFSSTGGSGSLVLSSSADNYTLNMTGENSAISVSPELPKYTFQPNYKYVKGNGKAVINLNLAKSSFSISVADIDGDRMGTFTIKDQVYYLVDNEKQLRLIGTADYPLSANYMLSKDIDLKKSWIPIGNNDAAPFTGRFIGNGFTIKNVSVDDQIGDYKYLGFFGLVKGGTIHNVTLENVSINTSRKSDVVVAPKGIVAAVILDGEMTDCVVK